MLVYGVGISCRELAASLCALYHTGVYFGKNSQWFTRRPLFYDPSVLSPNRRHIVSSFPITGARKDLYKVLKKDLAD